MLYCCKCSTPVTNIDPAAASVICWECCIESYWEKPQVSKPKSDKPQGWRFMKVYVHCDGTVYYKGIEQPLLKGTLPVTVIPPKVKKRKLTEQEKLDINLQISKLKKKLKTAKTKKQQKALEKEIKTLMKQL